MSDYFDRAFSKTIQHEGGYANDPADPGGETRYGISKRNYPDLDIKNLTLEQARDIYYRDYWLATGIDQVRHEGLAVKLFDLAVNLGPQTAVRLLQRAVNDLADPTWRLVEDGILGPMTAARINNYNHPEALLMALRIHAGKHYIDIAQSKSGLRRYLAGWLNRLAS